ncbi:MAG: 4'-phosphopantetheinyl transferase superfamily protein [Planctomycetota bacterium]
MTAAQLHLCQVHVPTALGDSRWEACLSDDERQRAGRYLVAEPRDQFVVGRGVLRHILGEALDAAPQALDFRLGEHGKPELGGAFAASGLHFNVSHSAEMVLIGWSTSGPVGVDVERVRPDAATDSICRRYFATREVEALFALPEEERAAGFFRYWTRKEAYLKVHGSGLSFPLGDFAVSLGDDAALVWHRHEPAETRRWQLTDVTAALERSGYAAAAICGRGAQLRWVPPPAPR